MNKTLLTLALVFGLSHAAWAATDDHAEKSPWERSITASYEKQSGNTDKSTAKLGFGAKWDVEKMRWTIDGLGTYGKDDGEKNVDKGKANTEYRYKQASRMYENAFLSAEYDKMADLDYRYIPGVGIGYTLYKSEIQEFSANVGPTYLMEKYSDGEKNDYWAAQLALDYQGKVAQGTKFWAKGKYNVRVEDNEQYLLSGEAGVEAPLGYGLGLRFVVTDEYNNRPAVDKEKNDVTLGTGLSFSF